MPKHRYATAIPPTSGDRQPARFLVVAVDSEATDQASAATTRNLRLVRWHSQHWTAESGRAGKIHLDTGTDPEAFWQLARSGLLRGGTLWVVCERAVQTMALLRLWRMVDEGVAKLGRRPAQAVLAEPEAGAEEPQGLLCLEDPPTAFLFHFPGFPGTIQVVDMANYVPVRSFGDPAPPDALQRAGQFVRAMVYLLSVREMGSLQVTSGAQAIYTLRRRFLGHGLSTHCRARTLALERASAHGGRVEAFRLGPVPGPVYQVDFTSQYCSICRDEALPAALWHAGFGGTERFEELLSRRAPLCCRVAVRTDAPHLPLRREGITIYPVGSFTTCLCGPEFYAAWDRKEIRAVYDWASYRTAPVLSDFAAEVLEIRKTAREWGGEYLEKWAKALGVALVGKFLQTGREWVDAPGFDLEDRWTVQTYIDRQRVAHQVRSVGGRVQKRVDRSESRWSVPALSAWVLAWGRRRLWDAMEGAGRGEVLYVGTDGLFLTEKGYLALGQSGKLTGGGPGRLRLVTTHDWIEVFGINHYRTPQLLVCAGRPPVSACGPESPGAVFRPRTAREQIAARNVPAAEEVLLRNERVRPYRHGLVGPDGRVSPWQITS